MKDARELSDEQLLILRETAILMREQGVSVSETARQLNVSRQVIYKWYRLFDESGLEGLEPSKRGRKEGEKTILSGREAAKIKSAIIDKNPDQLKMPFMLWTRAAVRDYIKRTLGKELSLRTVGNYLSRWGLTPQRPVQRASERNPTKIKEWMEEEYPRIRDRAKKENGMVFWGDETHFTNKVHNARGYSLPRNPPKITGTGKRLKMNMISAVSNKGEVRFSCYKGTMDQKRFIDFLKRLVAGSGGRKVFLIVDNLAVHHGKKVKKVKAWVAGEEKIELFYLPSYSPELNPDEYLNRDVKQNLNLDTRASTNEELRNKISGFMRRLQKKPGRVMSYFCSRYLRYAADPDELAKYGLKMSTI